VRRTISRIVLALVTLCFMLIPSSMIHADRILDAASNQEYSGIAKNETVYVILGHDGKVLDQRVVNRLYRNGEFEEIRDYGKYSLVRNMEASVMPEIQDNQIIWDGALLKKGDIYYEGVTDKELPIEVSIKYFLDGAEVNAPTLAGKSGNVRIEILIKNKLKETQPITFESYEKLTIFKQYEYYVPFLVQISYPVDLNIFSDIKADNAIKVTTGKTMNLNFATFPYPDAEVVFEMRGSNIELNSITFTVIPQVPPMPDVDIEDDLEKLLEGVKEIRKGLKQFNNASGSIIEGGKEIRKGQEEFNKGISALVEGSKNLNKNSNAIIAGFDSSLQGFEELKEGIKALANAFDKIAPGMEMISSTAKEVSSSVGSMAQAVAAIQEAGGNWTQGFTQLLSMNGDMVDIAQKLIAENPEGSELYKLGTLIMAQNHIINGLADGGTKLIGAVENLKQGMDALKGGLDKELIPGLEQVSSSINELALGSKGLLSGMEEYEKGQSVYREGIIKYTEGVGGIAAGLDTLSENANKLSEGLNVLVKAFEDINDGMNKFDTQGISEMERGIIQAIDDIRFVKALKHRMEELVDGYRSFVDNDRNKNSSVQFLMKTKEIVYEDKAETQDQNNEVPKENLWERLLNLLGL